MTTALRGLVLGALLAAAGCSGLSVDVDHDPQADFARLKTYDWHPGTRPKDGDAVATLTASRVERAVDDTLKAKGYVPKTGEPDFHVAYKTAIGRRVEAVPSAAVGVGYGGYGWRRGVAVGTTDVRTYDEGTLVLDVIDPKTKALIWRGIARAVVDPDRTPEEREQRIREAVQELLGRFPPPR
jgi:hypothetical protein